MRAVLACLAALVVAVAAPVGAVSLSQGSLDAMTDARIVILGEVHDNPAHHQVQAQLVARLAPQALVFEMLTPAQAARATPSVRGDQAALEAAIGWADSGWPDFALYSPIFLAAPDAQIFGAAVPREAARAAMQTGLTAAFGSQAAQFGLTDPLPNDEQAQREAMQMRAHCDALPEHILPAMVDIQRLRDARLAQEALRALADTGGPVVIITGNGHARADWGVPRLLERAAGDIRVFALAQTEGGAAVPGAYDAVVDGPVIDRPDPCAAFAPSGG